MAKAKKLPSGSWRVRVYNSETKKYVSFTAETEDKANLLALEYKLKNKNKATNNMTLSKAIDKYIESRNNVLSPTTIVNYKRMQKNYLQSIINTKINSLNIVNIQNAINIDSKKYAPKTIRNAHGLLSAVLKLYRPDMKLTTRLPQKKKKKIKIPSENDMKILLKAVENTNLEIPVLLAAFGSLRRSEISPLTDKDIVANGISVNKAMILDDDNKWIIRKYTKTFGSERIAMLPPFVIEKLKSIKGNLVELHPDFISDYFTKLVKSLNIDCFTFHLMYVRSKLLRHIFTINYCI